MEPAVCEIGGGWWILDGGCWIPDTGYRMLDAGYRMRVGCFSGKPGVEVIPANHGISSIRVTGFPYFCSLLKFKHFYGNNSRHAFRPYH